MQARATTIYIELAYALFLTPNLIAMAYNKKVVLGLFTLALFLVAHCK
jgi:hypothetical protein